MSIAILLATYNSERYLHDLLDSLFTQTITDFKCYVHDDGSTDGTKDIIKDYSERYRGSIQVLEYAPTGSAKANFLSMLQYVEEEYVMFCDHDDVWKNDKIESSLNKIKEIEGTEPALVFGDMVVVDEKLNVIHPSFMQYTGINPNNTSLNMLLVSNVVPGCTVIMNKKLYTIVRKCADYSHIRMHDQWCAMVAASTGKVVYLNKPTLLYRQHIDNVKGAGKQKSKMGKIIYIIKRLTSLSFFKERDEWHRMMAMQAYELSLLEEIDEKSRYLSEGFYNIQSKGKISRLLFYLKNNIHREKDNWWLLLWC